MSEVLLTVEIDRKAKEIRLPEGSTVETMLDSLGLYPDAHIVVRGKIPVPIDSSLVDGDQLRIVKVASGG
jgi:sulfur carrier protein ThiS